MAREILFCNPVLVEYIWGGTRLAEFGYKLNSDKVGECWIACAHPRGDCTISGGSFDGARLSDLWKNHRELFGNIAGEKFPILIKIIDAQSDLSIQVHPSDDYAHRYENGEDGKTECMYILDAKPDTQMIFGHNAKTKDDAQKFIDKKQWQEFIRKIPVHKGDFYYIESGIIHASLANTLIYEVQQNSDLTYRLYDFDRIWNGKLRELHIDKSLDVMKIPHTDSTPPKNENKTANKNICQLTSGKYFSVWRTQFSGENEITQDLPFMVISVVNGNGTVDGKPIAKGTNFILPHGYGTAHFSGDMELMISSV